MPRSGWFDEPGDNEEQSLTVEKPLLPPQKPRPKNAPQPRDPAPLPEGSAIVDPKFVTVSELAKRMGKTPARVHQLIHDGAIRTARIGKSFRIPEEDAKRAEERFGRKKRRRDEPK